MEPNPFEVQFAPPTRKYNAIQILALSAFSPGAYQDVAFRWKGTGLGYLLLLVLLVWVPLGIRSQVRAMSGLSGLETLRQDFPSVQIEDGVLSSPVDQPWTYELDGELLVLDTTGTASDELVDEAKVYVTAHSLTMNRDWDARSYEFEQVESFSLTGDDVAGYARTAALVGPAFITALGVVWSLVWRGLWGLVYGVAIMAAAKIDLQAGVRVGLVAVTPWVLLDTLWWLVGWTPPLWWVIGMTMIVAYLVFATASVIRGRPAESSAS